MCRTCFDCLLGSPSVPGMTSTKAKGFWPTWKDTTLLFSTGHSGEGAL